MAIETKLFAYFENLGGINAIDSEEAIPDNQQMMLQNVIISKAGTLKKRKGYQKKGNTLSPSSTIDGISLYHTSDVKELLAMSGGKVYRNTQKNVIVIDQLEILSIIDQTGNVCRITFFGTPDLSSAIAGYYLTIQGSSKTNNNDRFQIKTINTTSYYIDIYKTSVPADDETFITTDLKPAAAVHSEDLPVIICKLYGKLTSATNYDPIETTMDLTFTANHNFKVGDQLTVSIARDYAVTGVNLTNNYFEFLGADLSGIIPANHLTIYGSTGNDATYTSIVIDNTLKTITVSEVIPSAVVDGRGFIRYEDYGLKVESILTPTSIQVSGAFRDFSTEVAGIEIVYGTRSGTSESYDWNLDGYLEEIYKYPVFDQTPFNVDYVINTKDITRNIRVVGFEAETIWLDDKFGLRHGEALAVESAWDFLTGNQIAKEVLFDVKSTTEQELITIIGMQDNLYTFNKNDECYRYDGSRIFRAGFHKPPEILGAVRGASGVIGPGNYSYVYTYSYFDTNGLLIESQPSEPSADVVWTDVNYYKVIVKVNTIPKTSTNNGLCYDAENIYINLYRTLDQGSVYYLVTTIKNDTTKSHLNIEDNLSDDSLQSNLVPLYTTLEGEFANDTPPIAQYAVVWDNRIWCANGIGYQESLLQFLSTVIDHNTNDNIKISDGTTEYSFNADPTITITSIHAPNTEPMAANVVAGVNQGTKTFTFTNPISGIFRGDKVIVTGSTGNDGTYTVNTISTPDITVYEAIPSAVVDGSGTISRSNVVIYELGSSVTTTAGDFIRAFNTVDREKFPKTKVDAYDNVADSFRFIGANLKYVKPGDSLKITDSGAPLVNLTFTVESTDEVSGFIYIQEDLSLGAPVGDYYGEITTGAGLYPNDSIRYIEETVTSKPYLRIFNPAGIDQAASQGSLYIIKTEQTKFFYSETDMGTELDVLISFSEAVNSTKDCHVWAYWENIGKFQTLVLRERQRNGVPITLALDFNVTSFRPTLTEVMSQYKINDVALIATDANTKKSFFKTVKPARIWYSKAGQPESFVGSFDDINGGFYLDIDAQDGQEIMGICPSRNGLVVAKDNSHYLITASKDNFYTATKVDSDSGSKAGYSFAQVEGTPIFLSHTGAVQSDGYSVASVGLPLFRLYKNFINRDYVKLAVGMLDYYEDRYYVAVPYSESNITQTTNNYVLCWDVAKKAWTMWSNMPVRCWARDESKVYFGSYNGLVYQIREDNSNRDFKDDYAAIEAKVQTKWYDLTQPTSRKMFSKISLHLYNREQSSQASVKYAYDYSGGYSDVGGTAQIVEDWGSSTFAWGSSHWGTAGADAFRKALNPQKARAVKFSFENSAINQNLELLGWEIEAKLLTTQATKQK